MTKSLSKIATMDLPRSYSNLRRSLGVIVTYADNDSRVQVGVHVVAWLILLVCNYFKLVWFISN